MADSPYKVYLTEKIDELAKSLFAKRKLEKGTEAETLTKTLQDVGEIMFGKTGMAVDYLNTFLAGKAPETTFKLLDLFAANPTVKDRVMAEITRRVFGVRTKYEKRATLREGKNWLSGLDPCITVYQPNYDDVQWWGALGTFKISIAHPVQDEKSGKVGVMIYGEDEYKWAPDEKRPSQAIHKMAARLETLEGGAKRFPIRTAPVQMTFNLVDKLLARSTTTNKSAGRGFEGTGFTFDQVGRAIMIQYLR